MHYSKLAKIYYCKKWVLHKATYHTTKQTYPTKTQRARKMLGCQEPWNPEHKFLCKSDMLYRPWPLILITG
jgi:hypothetical protein